MDKTKFFMGEKRGGERERGIGEKNSISERGDLLSCLKIKQSLVSFVIINVN